MADTPTPVSKIRQLSSALFNRALLAMRLGQQFGGKRKLYDVFGYPKTLTIDHLLSKYQRQDITSRVVDMPPERTWSTPPTMKELRGGKEKWEEFVRRTQLWDRIIQADKLCAFGPFSVLWIGLPGAQDSPARNVSRIDDILYLQAYGAGNVEVKEYEDDTSKARYGQPTIYEIKVGPEASRRTKRVHFSRVVHIVDRPLQGMMFGEPRLAQIYNVLDDILKISGGSAETYWLTANRGMQVDVDKDMELQAGDVAALEDEIEEFQHQLRRVMRTRGVKITPLGSEVADPRGVFETLVALLASATSIPQRILTGAEAGQLASEQDRANWAEYVKQRRETFAEPYVLRPIMQRLGSLGYLPADAWEKAIFEWPEAFHMSPLELANARASDARAVVNFSRRTQFGNPVVTDKEAREMLGLPAELESGDKLPEQYVPPAKPQDDQPTSGPGKQEGGSATETPGAIEADPRANSRLPVAMERIPEYNPDGTVKRIIERPLVAESRSLALRVASR
jgi:hypothetical protein